MNSPSTVEALVNANIGLARFHARIWAGAGMDEAEALSRALAGLLRAAQRHVEGRGGFGGLATLCIKSSLNAARRRDRALKRGSAAVFVHLDSPVYEDGPTYAESVPDPGSDASGFLQSQDTCAAVASMLAELPPRWQAILAQRFGLGGNAPLAHSDIGQLLGVTKQCVQQTEAKALRRLAALAEQVFAARN